MSDRYDQIKKKRHPGGRPLKFASPEELQQKIDQYFLHCDTVKKAYTVSGLAVWLDSSREVLLNYGIREKFTDTIKKAKMRIEAYAEENLFKPGVATGMIFNLTNNWGWTNKMVTESKVDQRVTTTTELTDEELDKKLKELNDRIAHEGSDSTGACPTPGQ
jgi:hypothetical protein